MEELHLKNDIPQKLKIEFVGKKILSMTGFLIGLLSSIFIFYRSYNSFNGITIKKIIIALCPLFWFTALGLVGIYSSTMITKRIIYTIIQTEDGIVMLYPKQGFISIGKKNTISIKRKNDIATRYFGGKFGVPFNYIPDRLTPYLIKIEGNTYYIFPSLFEDPDKVEDVMNSLN